MPDLSRLWLLFTLCSLVRAAGVASVPAISQGTLAGFRLPDHRFLQATYGNYTILPRDSLAAVAPDDSSAKAFITASLHKPDRQYAALCRVKNKTTGILLVVFEWPDPRDTLTIGIRYHQFLSSDRVLLRVVKGIGEVNDTLEYLCVGEDTACGTVSWDGDRKEFVLSVLSATKEDAK